MDFRVETSAEAELDAISIFEWLISQEAGETGLRWFLSMEEAIASLAHFPERCPLAPENTQFPFEVRELLYGRRPHVFAYHVFAYSDASRHYAASCSRYGETQYTCFTFAMDVADRSGNPTKPIAGICASRTST
jgi:plasmid stabilization system protein ParE